MRWERFRALRFGPLQDYEVRFDAPMTVLEGENEAGKSTLMELGCGLFFGYMRRKEDRERLIHWGAREAVIEGDLRLEDGRLLTVRRTLRSQGTQTQILEDGRVREAGEQGLEMLQPIGREVYRNIYALTQSEMYFPTQGAWAMLQNRLLTGQVSSSLRPVSEVTEALQKEAMSIWRPDKRGKPQMEELSRELAALEKEWQEAGSRQAALSGLTRESARLARQKQEREAQVQQLEKALQEDQTRSKVKTAWAEVCRMREGAGDLAPFAALPEEPASRWQELCRHEGELKERLAQVEDDIRTLCQAVDAVLPQDATVLAYESVIQLIPGTRSMMHSEEDAKALLEYNAYDARLALDTLFADAWQVPPSQPAFLDAVDTPALHRTVNQAKDAQNALEDAQTVFQNAKAWIKRRGLAFTGILLCLGLWVGAAVMVYKQTYPMAGMLAALGFAAGIAALLERLSAKRQYKKAEKEADQAQTQREEAQTALEEALCGLVPQGIALEDILLQVEQGREALHRFRRAEDTLRHADERIRELRETLTEAACAILPSAALENPDEAMDALLAALDAARERERAAREAQASLPQLQQQQVQWSARLEEAAAEREALENLILSAGGSSVPEAAARLAQRRLLAQKADTLIEALRREFPDLDIRLQQLAMGEEAFGASPEPRQAELHAVREELAGIQTELGSLDARIRQLREGMLPGEAASLMAQQREKMELLARERDRLALALGVIRAAEKRYRHENQPEIIRNAADYLAAITQERYDRLALNEKGDGLIVHCRDTRTWLDPARDRLSKGTLEQLYLALRLSLMDHLDPEGEHLPLFLDETLINWDTARTQGGLSVLDTIAKKRQVLLFTCHSWIPNALDSQGIGYQHVRLYRNGAK